MINIIVPVYGVERYLARCVDSLLVQTHNNIRVILVDDGSPDDCPRLCDNYAEQDSRITVLHRTNGGLSAARNTGLDYLFSLPANERGEYVAFVDSDDWVSYDYVAFLLKLLVDNNADIAQCGHYISYSSSREVSKNNTHCTVVLSRIDALDSLCRNGIWDVTTWNKLYKLELFREVRFPEGKSYEDTATCYLLAAQCNRFAVNMAPKYHYVQRYTSIANGTTWKDSKYDLIEAGDALADWIQKNYPSLHNAAIEKRIYVRLSTLAQMVNTRHYDKLKIYKFRKYIQANCKTILLDKKTAKRDKLGTITILLGFPCYKLLWKIYYLIKRRHK